MNTGDLVTSRRDGDGERMSIRSVGICGGRYRGAAKYPVVTAFANFVRGIGLLSPTMTWIASGDADKANPGAERRGNGADGAEDIRGLIIAEHVRR